MNPPSRLVLRFLASVGRPAEAELYLSLFRAERPESFALIAVDPDVTGVAAEALAVDLDFLAELGLTPVLALGSAEQAAWLQRWLAGSARGQAVEPARAAEVARAGRIPLVPLDPAEVPSLAAALASRKVVLLGTRGPLARAGGEAISIIDVTSEYDALSAPGALPDPDRAILARARAVLDAAPRGTTVSVTSPLALIRELFTVRGAGTLVRRGAPIAVYPGWDGLDRARIASLIEDAFGRPLRAEFWDRPAERIYLAGDYRGAAVVERTAHGPYLSKLAVGPAARGEGIGRDLWRALVRDYASLYWRSRAHNPIAPWYQEQCDGMVKDGEWHVYWRGLPPERIPEVIRAARSAPVDL